jgi:hypothetical protein
MGQGIGRVPEAPAVGGDATGREPVGRYIGQQRRLRGIELEDLAARTRIPRRSLERLEAGAFDHSPDGFSRGFVRTVAEAIGLDPDDAVARMLPEPDSARRASARGGRAPGVLVGVLAVAALALLASYFATGLPSPPRRAADAPVRRDYVRALAEAQGIATARLDARAAALEPLPPEPLVELPPAKAAAHASGPIASTPARPAPAASQPAAPAALPAAIGAPVPVTAAAVTARAETASGLAAVREPPPAASAIAPGQDETQPPPESTPPPSAPAAIAESAPPPAEPDAPAPVAEPQASESAEAEKPAALPAAPAESAARAGSAEIGAPIVSDAEADD